VLLTGAWSLSFLLYIPVLDAFAVMCAATPPTVFWVRSTLPLAIDEPEMSSLHELYNEFHNATKPAGFDDVDNIYRYQGNGELDLHVCRIDFVPPVLPAGGGGGVLLGEEMTALCMRANPRAADLYDTVELASVVMMCTLLLVPLMAALVAHGRLCALRRAEEHGSAVRQAARAGTSPQTEAHMAQLLAARGWVVSPPAPALEQLDVLDEACAAPVELCTACTPVVSHPVDKYATA
jgi:hypothetical protein